MRADPNKDTIAAYEAHIADYVRNTAHELTPPVKAWTDDSLSRVPAGSTVLEIGAGFGRDADYIEGKGFRVVRTDAAAGFVGLMRVAGHAARLLDVLADDIGGPWAMVYADAVVLHFTPAQAASAFSKIRAALRPGGVFAFCVKRGDGESWQDAKLGVPRYFCFWQEPALRAALRLAGFGDVSVATVGGGGQDWLMVIAAA